MGEYNSYKKIIKSRKTRLAILKMLSFIPDKTMVQIQYKIKTGNKLDLKNPKRYTEKLQWYKLYYHDPLITQCSDKNEVRKYVADKGLDFLLNEQYGVYNNADEIDFDVLPDQFVIKATKDSGNNIIVKDKSKLNIDETRKEIDGWLDGSKSSPGREWGYYGVKNRIIIEKFIGRDKNNDLPDYKFFCFGGKVFCMYTMVNYTDDHSKGRIGFYDREYNKLPCSRVDYGEIDFDLEKPKNYEKMVEYAEILSKDFPHARVDFYDLDGIITFGEITFYNASGYTKFNPDSFDFEMGDQFVLPEKKL